MAESSQGPPDGHRYLPRGGGLTVWMTGLPGAGKSTLSSAVAVQLEADGLRVMNLDGDILRNGLNTGLGYSREDRAESVRRAGEVALLLAADGAVVLVSLVSPYADHRELVRRRHAEHGVPFVEVWLSTPLEVCEARDPKQLYERARKGEISCMTGIDDPYELPVNPDVAIPTHELSVVEARDAVIRTVHRVRREALVNTV